MNMIKQVDMQIVLKTVKCVHKVMLMNEELKPKNFHHILVFVIIISI